MVRCVTMENEELKEIYVKDVSRVTHNDHYCSEFLVVALVDLETLREFSDETLQSASHTHFRFLKDANIWCTYMENS